METGNSQAAQEAPLRLLFVEDDDDLRGVLADYFVLRGYAVDTAADGAAFLRCLAGCAETHPDLILLDLNLPDADGLHLLAELRRASRAPVFIVSGRIDLDSRLAGLRDGADDYIVKPFDMRELEWRIHNFLQRQREEAPSATGRGGEVVCGSWRVDFARLSAFHVDGTVATLTAGEAALLQELLAADGRVVRRNRIVAHIVGKGIAMTEESLPVLVSRLRAKLGVGTGDPAIIAVPNQGYRIAPRAGGGAD